MKFGPTPEDASSSAYEPQLPGEFVSEDLRVDCARFLYDVRKRAALRTESPVSGYWLPAHALQRDSRKNS